MYSPLPYSHDVIHNLYRILSLYFLFQLHLQYSQLSKNLISLIRRVTQLSNNELENIQESFLTNKIDDIVSSLDSSKNLIDDTKDVVSVLMKYFSAKNTTKYEKESILKDIAALLEKKEEGSSLDQNEKETA